MIRFPAYEWIAPVAVAGACAALQLLPFMERVENLVVDQRIRFRAAQGQPAPDPRALFITIDDSTIATLGRWPFPRSYHGDFMQVVAQGQPGVFAWDIILDAPSTPDDDVHLLKSLDAVPVPVLFAAASISRGRGDYPLPENFSTGWQAPGGLDAKAVPRVQELIMSFPALRERSTLGLADAEPAPGGVIRSIQMVVRAGDQLVPTLSLATLMRYWNLQPSQIRIVPGDAIYIDAPVARRRIPIDHRGHTRINYRYELEDYARARQAFAYQQLLKAMLDKHVQQVPGAQAPDVQGKILFIGQASTALTDVGPTPRSEQSPLPLMHLNLLDNILKEDYLRTVPAGAVWAVVVLLGWASLLLLRRAGFALMVAVPLVLIGLYLGAAFLLFNRMNLLLPVVPPVLALTALHMGSIGGQVLRERRARRQLRQSFSAYVPPAVLESIYKHPDRLGLGGATREVAILFSDIRGFTTMTEAMDSQELVGQLNEYFTEMVGCISRHQGSLHKYIGDAVMAVWGDITNEGPGIDAGLALRAALDMRAALGPLNRRWEAAGRPAFRIGIGLSHGRVVVGEVGAPQRREFTVMGDAVNTASRIEGVTKKFGLPLVVSETIHDLACERFAFRPLSKVRLAGKVIPVRTYEPLYELGREADCPYDLDWVKLYTEAHARFEERRWEVAVRLFEACLHQRPEDQPTNMLLELSRELVKNMPPPDWDGAFEFDSK